MVNSPAVVLKSAAKLKWVYGEVEGREEFKDDLWPAGNKFCGLFAVGGVVKDALWKMQGRGMRVF